MKRKSRSSLPRIKNPYYVVSVSAAAALVLVLVFVAAVTSGNKITRYLRTGWPTSSPSPSCYGDTCPSPSPTSGSCNFAVAPKRTEPLQGPGEFNLAIDWDRIADAQRYGDTRKVSAYLRTPYRTQPYFLTEQGLSGQCMQPDADVVVGVPKPFADCSTNKISDTTPVELLVKVEGASPDGYKLKITGWDENCPKITTITRDGAGNVTASKCSGTFGQLKGKKSVTAKVRSTYRNASEILGPPPSCGSYPNDYPCPAPTCYQRPSCKPEIIGTYTAEDGLKVVNAITLPPYGIIGINACGMSETGISVMASNPLVAEQTWRVTLSSGRVFVGTANELAAQISQALRLYSRGIPSLTPRELLSIIAAAKDAKQAGGAVVLEGAGAAAGGATAVSAGTAACWAAGGAVLVAEVAFMGWEVYDIGSSANSYCNAGGDLSGFLKTTCNIYYTGDPTGSRWCWPDWIPF